MRTTTTALCLVPLASFVATVATATATTVKSKQEDDLVLTITPTFVVRSLFWSAVSVSGWAAAVLAVVGILCTIGYVIYHQYLAWKYRNIPGENTMLSILNFVFRPELDFIFRPRSYDKDGKLRVKYGDTYKTLFGTYLFIHARDPEIIKQVFVTKSKVFWKDPVYSALTDFDGTDIFTSNGDVWQRHRLLANPAFTDKNLVNIHNTSMAQIAKDLCEKWDEMLGEQEKRLQRQQKKQELMQHDYSNNVPPETTLSVNLNDWISRVSFDTISLAGFGYPNNSVKGSPIMVRIVEHLLIFATIRAIVLPARIRNLFLVRKVLMRSSEKKLDRWKEMLSAIIANRQREMSKSVFSRSEASKQNKGGSSDSGSDNEESAQSAPPKALSQKKSDLLSFLMNAKDDEEQPYTLGELMADLSIFMFAGHETTSAVMAWCIYYLARYPEIQRRLHCEVDGILQDLPADGIPTYEMTKKMSYALCIMKEVMRLHPPAYTLVRTAMDDVELDWKDGKKLMVPKGAMVQAFAAQLFRDPRYWEEPDKFMPERFEKTPQDSPYYKYMHNPYIFFPFGVGQRSCVGSRFAELEVCLVLAMVCRRFWFSLDTTTTTTTTTTTKQVGEGEEVPEKILITMKPDTIKVRIARRTRSQQQQEQSQYPLPQQHRRPSTVEEVAAV